MPTAIVIMGVGGSGKTTVGGLLAHRLGVRYLDADSLHPVANIEKMRSGCPLNDDDREPWLTAVAELLARSIAGGDGVVVSCSALKRRYRDMLRVHPAVCFLHLAGRVDVVRARLAARSDHFFGIELLASQFADLEPLEPDEHGALLDIGPAPDEIADAAEAALAVLWARPAPDIERTAEL
ncbi:gluconokinase [Actinoplanes sp. NPDC049265]|uniref:gluconokinase n=1 Tax=Actinoplanes sp. NPDC049265 TaxID=3363902 RepID=UPI00372131A3